MFLLYHQDPDATEAAYDRDGYYKTGDIGRRRKQYFFISEQLFVNSQRVYKVLVLENSLKLYF